MAAPIARSGLLGGNVSGGAAKGLGLDITFIPSPLIMVKDFDKLGLDIRSFKEPLGRAVRKVMIPSIKQNFDAEGRPAWEPLSSNTIDIRDYYGFDAGPILNRTGRLKRRASQINIWTVTRTEAFIGSLPPDVWYGNIQQGGASLQAAGGYTEELPARPFAVLQESDMNDIEEVFFVWIEERMAASGFHL